MRIDQVLVSAVPGDAVTSIALQMRELLRRLGESDIFSRYVHVDLEEEIFLLPELPARRPTRSGRDWLIYHASIGEPDVARLLTEAPERLALHYHNISPERFFRPYDDGFADLLGQGRDQIAALKGRVELAWADSEFNAEELRVLGYTDVKVVPPMVDLTRLTGPSPSRDDSGVDGVEGPVLLFVGQLLPHKRVEFLLGVLHVLTTYLTRPVTLGLVGPARLSAYQAALHKMVDQADLRTVVATGAVSDSTLQAWYRRADVFLTASEHEGFCFPTLEAMALDLPVVARANGALPETLDDAALLLPGEAAPEAMAEAVMRVLGEPPLRQSLIHRGRRRAAELGPGPVGSAWWTELSQLAAR